MEGLPEQPSASPQGSPGLALGAPISAQEKLAEEIGPQGSPRLASGAPASASELFWRCPAPLAYVALCVVVIAALYGISEQLSSRVEQRVSNLKIKQEEAVREGEAALVQQFVRDTARLSTLKRGLERWVIICVALCGVGQACAVFRLIRRPDSESGIEWWVLLIMNAVLCVQFVGISIGWVALLVIA